MVRYVAGLSWAYLLTLAEVVAIVMSLGGRSTWNAQGLVILAVQVIAGTTLVAVGATLTVRPTLRWLESGSPPTDKQVRNASRITRRQAAITLAPWMLATAILIPLNHTAGAGALMVIASTMLFGAVATVSTGFLFTLRTLRPILAGVSPGRYRRSVPGVRSRLLIMWLVCTALPGSAIALLLVMRSNSWLIDESTSIDLALLVLALVAVLLGLRAMILVSMSISDPVNQVIEAMAEAGLILATLPPPAEPADVPTVDEAALIRALEERWIAGAGLDVFEQEPLSASSPLPHMLNVVALPHIGSATHETREAMTQRAVDNTRLALQGKPPISLVNKEVNQ